MSASQIPQLQRDVCTQRLQPNPAVLCTTGSDLTGSEYRGVHTDTEARGQTEQEASRVASSQLYTEGNFDIQNMSSYISLTFSASSFLRHTSSCLAHLICTSVSSFCVSVRSFFKYASLKSAKDTSSPEPEQEGDVCLKRRKGFSVLLFPLRLLFQFMYSEGRPALSQIHGNRYIFFQRALPARILGGRTRVHTVRHSEKIHYGASYIIVIGWVSQREGWILFLLF